MNKLLPDKILKLLYYNRILECRVKGIPFISELMTVLFIIAPVAMTLYFVTARLKVDNMYIDSDVVYIIFILLLISITSLLMHYSADAIITPEKLTLVPHSRLYIYNYLLAVTFINKRVLIYVIPILLLTIGIFKYSIFGALLSFVVIIGSFIVVDIFILNLYLLLRKNIESFKKNITAIPSIILIFLILSDKIIGYENMPDILYFGSIGTIVENAVNHNLHGFYVLLCVNTVLIIFGIFAGRELIIRKL